MGSRTIIGNRALILSHQHQIGEDRSRLAWIDRRKRRHKKSFSQNSAVIADCRKNDDLF